MIQHMVERLNLKKNYWQYLLVNIHQKHINTQITKYETGVYIFPK